MANMTGKTEAFRALHVVGAPVVLFNVWDAGSAKVVAASGAKAIATSSWSVAAAHGFADGERLPLARAIDNLRRIVQATDLPVTVDLESGYDDVGTCIRLAIDAGAVGCNLEDSVPADGSLRRIAEQCERLCVARHIADGMLAGFFINARTDVFLGSGGEPITRAIERAHAYADAGANGLFAPGLADGETVARLAQASPLPLNLMIDDGSPPVRELAALGVARLSYGPTPYALAMRALADAARAAVV